MYRVYYENEQINTNLNGASIFDAKISYADNTIPQFKFTVPSSHPMAGDFALLKGEVLVKADREVAFRGRVIEAEEDFNGDLTLACEGQMAYLRDCVMYPYNWSGTIEGFVNEIVYHYNQLMPVEKQITIGTIEGSKLDSNDYITRSNEDATTVWDTLQDKLVNELGGYIELTDDRVLNYWADYPGTNEQEIDFGKNLLDISQYLDATEVITAIKAYGAKKEEESTSESDSDEEEDIEEEETVSNGTYDGDRLTTAVIENATGIALYGYILGTETWDDVTEEENLITKATARLEELVSSSLTIKASALDLSLTGDYEHIKHGLYIRVKSAPHKLNVLLPVTALELNLSDPGSTVVTIGKEMRTLTSVLANLNAYRKGSLEGYATTAQLTIVQREVNETYKSVTPNYLATDQETGVTTETEGWTTEPQAITSEKKYLWQYSTYTKTDGTTSTSEPVISGVYGDTGNKGDDGESVTVKSTSITYQAGTSGTTKPTGTWSTSVPSVSEGQYLWTRTIVKYSDGTSTTTYTVAYQGENGADGKDGTSVTVSSTSITYQAGTSGTTKPTGTWSTSVPSVSEGQYLWTRTVVTYSDGTAATWYSVAYQGKNGTSGVDGTSVDIMSTSVTYQVGSSGTTKPTGTWSTEIPYTAGGAYLWAKTVVTYSDGTSTTTYSVSRQGEDGATGATGATGASGTSVSAVTPLYYASNTSTEPSAPTTAVARKTTTVGQWTTVIPAYTHDYCYVYTCSQIKWSTGTYTWTTVCLDRSISAVAGWCSKEDITLIDGSKIYTGSVSAEALNADTTMSNKIFANDITATGNIFFDNDYYSIAASGNDIALTAPGTLDVLGGMNLNLTSDVGYISLGSQTYVNVSGGETDPLRYSRASSYYPYLNTYNTAAYVTAEGDKTVSGTVWHYRKWSNGYAECFGVYTFSAKACTTAFVSGRTDWYKTADLPSSSGFTFPFTFKSAPAVTYSFNPTTDGVGAMLWIGSINSTTAAGEVNVLRPASTSSLSGKIIITARGEVS